MFTFCLDVSIHYVSTPFNIPYRISEYQPHLTYHTVSQNINPI